MLSLAAVGLLFGTACLPSLGGPTSGTNRNASGVTPSATDVTIHLGKSVRGDLTGVVTYAVNLQARGTVMVVPRVAGTLTKFDVDLGARVKAGDPLAELDSGDLQNQLLQAQAAQAAADARVNELKGNPRPDALAAAQANLKAAQARLDAVNKAQSTATSNQQALQQQVNSAKAALDKLQSGAPDPNAVAQADAAVTAAQTKLNQLLADSKTANDKTQTDAARADLAKAQADAASLHNAVPNPNAVAAAQLQVQAAQQQLLMSQLSFNVFDADQAKALVDAAQAQVNLLSTPATPEQINAAQAEDQQAAAETQLAQNRLKDATVVAPIDGIVTDLQATVGNTVGPSGPILTLIPPQLGATLQITEAQAAQLSVGLTAQVSVQDLPDQSFTGTVKGIAPVVDPRTRTVAVNVAVDDPQGKLRPGTFAQLAIPTGQDKNVVTVPKEAILQGSGSDASNSYVYMVVDSRVKRQRVVVGPTDGKSVEITQGLAEGVDVLLNPSPDLIDGQQVVGA